MGMALLLVALVPPVQSAPQEATPYYGGITLEPLQPTDVVELLFQTVDAAIREEAGTTFLEVTCTFGLHNLSKAQEAGVRLGFPSWLGGNVRFDPTKLTPVSLAVDGQAIAWEKTAVSTKLGGETRSLDWFVWWMGFARDGQRTVTLKYRANLGEDAMPRFAFALVGTGWAGKVGSARVSLHFPTLTTYTQLANVQGSGTFFDGKSLTWTRVTTEEREEVGANFIKPSLWDEVEAARERLRQGIDSAQIHYRLGQAYLELADEGPSFLSEAIAELERAKELNPAFLEARRALFQVYSSTSGVASLKPAIGEAEALIAANAEGRDKLEKWLADAYIKLASEYEAQGLFSQAIEYLDKARPLAAKADPGAIKDLDLRQERTYLGWTLQLLQEGRTSEALALAQKHLSSTNLVQDNSLKPYIGPFQAEIELWALAKSFHLEISFAPQLGSGDNLQQEFIREAQGVGRSSRVEIDIRPRPEGLGLDITLVASSPEELQAQCLALAKAFQASERMKPLAGLFTADTLELREGGSPFHEASRLEGKVDLVPLAQNLQAQANESEARLRPLQGRAGESQLRAALLERYRQDWLRVLGGSHARYRIVATTPGGASTAQEFALSLGESRDFILEAKQPKPLAYGLAGVLVVILAAGIWMILSRTRGKGAA